MLPQSLRHRALLRAKQKGVSLGELIRESLEAALRGVGYDVGDDPLFEIVIYDGAAPPDAAAKHDKYLYDGES
jgi:hypothetical protein